jgi:RNA polymerase sigma-70 factor (ECF subfamily)
MTQPVPSHGVPDDAEQHRADPLAPRPAEAPSDNELVARVRLGDAEAFEQLFHTYYEPLCAFVLGYVGSPAAAEDVVQETFVRIWERRTEWDVRGKVRSYLYSAVRNRALTQLRHTRVVARTQERTQREVTLGGRAPAQSDERVRMDEMAQALARAIDRLPARRRQAYTLRWQHELSMAEIAGVMGVTVKCAEAHLAAASKAIREALAKFL